MAELGTWGWGEEGDREAWGGQSRGAGEVVARLFASFSLWLKAKAVPKGCRLISGLV